MAEYEYEKKFRIRIWAEYEYVEYFEFGKLDILQLTLLLTCNKSVNLRL